MSGREMVRVELLGLPIAVHRRANEHGETLRRELALLRHSLTDSSAPARLRKLGIELFPRYRGLNVVTDQRLADALANDEATIDLVYEVPAGVADDFVRLLAVLEELDRFCAERELLTLVPSAEGVAYRAWWIGEFIEQIRDGRPPRPWQDHHLPGADTAGPEDCSPPGSTTATVTVQGDLDLEQAPTLRAELVRRIDDGATSIVVDLAACDFMDSTGLSLLLTTRLRLEAEGGSLALRNLNEQVASVIELSGVDGLLT